MEDRPYLSNGVGNPIPSHLEPESQVYPDYLQAKDTR